MEFFFFFFMSFFLCLIITTLFIYLFIYKPQIQLLITTKNHPTNNNEKLPLPPGSTGWPLIGETIDYISKYKNGVIHNFVTDRISKYSSNVFKTSLLGHPVAILYGPEGNKFLFNNERKLVQAWTPPHLEKLFDPKLNHDQEGLIKLQKTFTHFIKGTGLQKLIGKMDSVMIDHLETTWDREEIMVAIEVRKYTLKLVLLLFLSVDDPKKIEEFSLLLDDLRAGITSLPVNLPGTTYNRGIRASKLMIEVITDIMKQRKIDILEKTESPTQDLLYHMLLTNGANGQFLEDYDVAITIQSFIFAGFDNLNTTLTFITKYLAELPHVYDEVLREQMEIAKSKEPETLLNWDDLMKMKYSWNVVREVLRLCSPSVGTFKETIIEFTYAGFTFPKGLKLHWISSATHKDPKYFLNPETFDPSRFDGKGPTPFSFVPFGGGPRMCPGNEYARAAILVFMHNVVTKFKWEKLIPNGEVINGSVTKLSQGFPIRLYPHEP